MDPDYHRPSYHSSTKTYYSTKNKYRNNLPASNKTIYNNQHTYKSSPKQSDRANNQTSIMNQLAPRFQQRALYSQHYRTEYDSSWRANLLAASYRIRKPVIKIINLGERPDPEGAPAFKAEEREVPKNPLDYDHILDNDVWLYSDYGSDSEDPSELEDSNSVDGEQNIPNATWSTASLLSHAFNKTSSNKVTIMSYAVIGAELNSITKLHTTKTEGDLCKLTKKTLRLTENIDNARKSLKDIALGLRALKQELKSKTKRCSSNRDKSLKNSSTSLETKSDMSFAADDTDKRLVKIKSAGLLDQSAFYYPKNYFTIDRRHKVPPRKTSHCFSEPKFSMIKCMNPEKRSSSEEF